MKVEWITINGFKMTRFQYEIMMKILLNPNECIKIKDHRDKISVRRMMDKGLLRRENREDIFYLTGKSKKILRCEKNER